MAIATANDLFTDELKDIYSAEKQAVRVYPKLAKAVESGDLKQALEQHLEQTRAQVERLDRVFQILGKRPAGKTCEGMKGVLEESTEAIEKVEQGPVRDVALLAAAQRAEHYEIAAYGTVVALARAMGQREIVELLSQTLEEEKAVDKQLTGISRGVNKLALTDEEEEEEEDDDELEEDDELDEDEEEDEAEELDEDEEDDELDEEDELDDEEEDEDEDEPSAGSKGGKGR